MSNPDPLVSVVIPTHNRGRFVAGAIRSVQAQEQAEVEVIVVDDASTDETKEVLAAFGPTLRVIRTEVNIERGAARNLGVRHASGRFVAFLDSDDTWSPEKLQAQLPELIRNRPCLTGIKYVDENGRQLGRIRVPPRDASDRLAIENPFPGVSSCLALPVALFNAAGGFPEAPDVQGSEDWVLMARLKGLGGNVGVVAAPLVSYTIHRDGHTSDVHAVARSMWAAAALMQDEGLVRGSDLRRLRTRTAGVIGRQYARAGNWHAALAWARTAMEDGLSPETIRALTGITASGSRHLAERFGSRT